MATFCLIHGKWHDASSWNPLPDQLASTGQRVIVPTLPYEDPRTTYAQRVQPALDAIAAIRPAVDAVAPTTPNRAAVREQASDAAVASSRAAVASIREPVVVVGHSLGAGYAPVVAAALPDALLVYVCPAPVGPFDRVAAPMRASREGFKFPPNRADGTSVWDPDEAIRVLYPRLPADAARSLAQRLRPGASPSDAYPLSAQPAVPTTVLYARHDEFFEPDWSRWIAREIVGVEPIELDTGHFPMVEAPETLADVLLAAVEASPAAAFQRPISG